MAVAVVGGVVVLVAATNGPRDDVGDIEVEAVDVAEAPSSSASGDASASTAVDVAAIEQPAQAVAQAFHAEVRSCMEGEGHAYEGALPEDWSGWTSTPWLDLDVVSTATQQVDEAPAAAPRVDRGAGQRSTAADEALWSEGGCADEADAATYGAIAERVGEPALEAFEEDLDGSFERVLGSAAVEEADEAFVDCVADITGTSVPSAFAMDVAVQEALDRAVLAPAGMDWHGAMLVEAAGDRVDISAPAVDRARSLETALVEAGRTCGEDLSAALDAAMLEESRNMATEHPRIVGVIQQIATSAHDGTR